MSIMILGIFAILIGIGLFWYGGSMAMTVYQSDVQNASAMEIVDKFWASNMPLGIGLMIFSGVLIILGTKGIQRKSSNQ
jgi:hypothetical protein